MKPEKAAFMNSASAASNLYPSYIALAHTGELRRRVKAARDILNACTLCPKNCRAPRTKKNIGACQTTDVAKVCAAHPHFGEESPLVGKHGSGTIFLSWCNLSCVFCQNAEISAEGEGRPVNAEQLATMMLDLQAAGCHNVNLVSPTHVVPQILEALEIAIAEGLRIPLVYNTGGYDSVSTLRLLDGIVDIYMPDMKYADATIGLRFSGVPDYPEINRAAVLEMHRQVGDLVLDEQGIAKRGLLVRHLVLPDNLAGTEAIMQFLAQEVSPDTYVNIMAQYHPAYRAAIFPSLNRRITPNEYRAAIATARKVGIHRLDERPLRWLLE